jgi:hypothetical protein
MLSGILLFGVVEEHGTEALGSPLERPCLESFFCFFVSYVILEKLPSLSEPLFSLENGVAFRGFCET